MCGQLSAVNHVTWCGGMVGDGEVSGLGVGVALAGDSENLSTARHRIATVHCCGDWKPAIDYTAHCADTG
jgi:hypothetical protein